MRRRILSCLAAVLVAGSSPPAGASHDQLSPTSQQAVTVALHALVEAGLFDPLGDYYSYEAVSEADGVWTVSFVASHCYRTERVETCDPYQGRDDHTVPDAWLEVTESDGSLTVVGARGRFREEDRAELLGYAEPSTPQPARLEFPTARLDPPVREGDDEGWTVRGADLWAGVIPADDRLWEICTVELLDENGAVVTTLPSRHAHGSRGEAFRAGGLVGMGVEDPQGAVDARFVCEPFSGETWRVRSGPDVSAHGGRVYVSARMTWVPGYLVGGLDSRCDVALYDRTGREVKTVDRRGPPSPWVRGRLSGTFVAAIAVARPARIESADVFCHEA
ncbi:MAG TPA: hypothetical protein VHI71_02120 [Actinomycetota bacterium]|nr:hypothetical protein [Actinomycetota bacterium]